MISRTTRIHRAIEATCLTYVINIAVEFVNRTCHRMAKDLQQCTGFERSGRIAAATERLNSFLFEGGCWRRCAK